MLSDLDEIPWDGLGHAYGPAADVPAMVRAAASQDADEAFEGVDSLYGAVLHQGTVYTSTPAVLPFVLEIVKNPRAHHRGALTGFIGAAAEGDHDGSIHAVLRDRVEQIFTLLADDDDEVRGMAAFTLGHLGDVPVNRLRWLEERNPRVRASILVAACRIDLGHARAWLPDALGEPAPVQAAAAYMIGTNGLPWSQEATDAVVSCHADGDPLASWAWDHSWLSTLLAAVSGETVRDVVAALTQSGGRDVRVSALFAAGDAMHAKRSLPALLVPVLAPLLADPDEGVRRTAAWQIEKSGRAATVADELAALAASPEAPANPLTTDPRTTALCALIGIGDPRWRAQVLDGRPLDGVLNALVDAEVPIDEELLAAVRTRLAADPGHNERIRLLRLLDVWGPEARPALPEVLAAPEEPLAARIVYDLTADVTHLLKAVEAGVDDARVIGFAADLGEQARPLMPKLEQLLAQEKITFPGRSAQVEAAKLHWSVHHDLATILPVLTEVLRAGDYPAVAAIDFVTELPDRSLMPLLEDLLTDKRATVAAARALWRLTGRAAIEPVLQVVRDGWPSPHDAVALLVEMRATTAIDVLAELADRDERVVTSSNDMIKDDERLRVHLGEAVRVLRKAQSEMSSR